MRHEKRRIAFIHDEFPGGGGERVTIDVADYLAVSNYEVFVFAGKYAPEKLPSGTVSGFSVITLPERYVERSKKDAEAMISSINDLGISVLVSVGRQMLYIEEIREKTRCKYVYALHSIPFWETNLVVDDARRRGEKSCMSKLEWYVISYPKYVWFGKAFRKIRQMYRHTYDLSDRYVVLCDDYKRKIVEEFNLDPENNKLRVIPNSERKAERVNWDKKKQLLYIGRMSYVDKRVDRLVDVWQKIYKKLPEWELVLVGDGDERAKLEQEVRRKQLERVRFVGFSNHVSSFYQTASILCLVSSFEGWPLCLTEAQANAVVPVSFDCSAGVREIISPSGTNGLLVPPFDLNRYAEALLSLIGDPARLEKMRHHVVKKAEAYAMDAVGKRWVSMLDELFSEDVVK